MNDKKNQLQDAEANAREAAREKETEDWKYFKTKADSIILGMETDLKKIEAKIEKADKTNQKKLQADYNKAKNDIISLKEKLHRKDIEFENNAIRVDNSIPTKNPSFKRGFKHDMDELGKSLKG